MTVKKALEIVDWWIDTKHKIMEHLKNEWHYKTFEEATGVAKMLFDMDKVHLENLQEIRKELVPNCKHPKEDRDLDPSTRKPYCMACNWDL